ncbi:MAG: aminodeoxychorismate lyase [Pseudomonadota bacterium]
MYLINGQLEAVLPIRDRGLAFGDGVFETIAIINNKPHNWLFHFNRLSKGAKRLGIEVPVEGDLLTGIALLSMHKPQQQKNKFIVKIIYTRGEGGKGYLGPDKPSANCIMILNSWPTNPAEYYLQGINVQQLDFKLSEQSVLAGIKHLNRLEQVIARQQLALEYQEALLLNNKNCVIEGISSNIFFVVNNTLCIPLLNVSGIEGTIRAQVIELCLQFNIEYQIHDFSLDDIKQSQEIFYSNSIIGLWPVKKLQLLNEQVKQYPPGEVYKQLAEVINKQLGHPYIFE